MNRISIFQIMAAAVILFLFTCSGTQQRDAETEDQLSVESDTTEAISTEDSELAQDLSREDDEPDPVAEEMPVFEEGRRYSDIPRDADGNPLPLTMEETVRLVLDNNNAVRLQQLEILQADTELARDLAQYAPTIGAAYEGMESREKPTPSTLFSGDRMTTDRYSAYINKLFRTGTYFQVEVSDSRFDSNAGENIALQGTDLARISQPPLHTGALSIMIRQELLRNSFGYSQRRMNQIARNNARILRQDLEYQLTSLVVRAMVDYWELSIAEENLRTAELLLNSTRNIRNITIQKRNIGLAETFEINQWNALLAQAETAVDNARLERDSKRRQLLRTMNLDPDLELTGATDLRTTRPTDVNLQADIELALESRPDLRNVRLQMQNAKMMSEVAENNRLPSVTLGGSYSSRDIGRRAETAFHHVPRGTYPESSVEFRVEYPLWDEGRRVDSRNARIAMRQLAIQEEEMERQVSDEIRDGFDRINVSFEGLQRAERAVQQSQAFYNGLIVRYRQGRFTAEAIKNALDALIQSRQGLTQARINYNISLIRYDLTRNYVFDRYGIDIDETLDRIKQDPSAYREIER